MNSSRCRRPEQLHEIDTWMFFRWIFKTFVAVLLVTNTWNIVMGVFDMRSMW